MELLCGRKSPRTSWRGLFSFIEGLIGTTPCHIELYHQALTHSSYHTIGTEQEREAIMNGSNFWAMLFCIVPYLPRSTIYTTKTEGQLSHLRSLLVSRKNMNALASALG